MCAFLEFACQLTACFRLYAWFRNYRFILGSGVPVFAAGLRATDTVYNPLPLYHSSAGVLCCGPCFYVGLSIALRKKFSAKEYWKDCVKYKATVSTALYLDALYTLLEVLKLHSIKFYLMTLN